MNKNKELAKNTAILTIGKISTQFISFLLMPLYTSILSTNEYGVVDLIVTYTSLLLPIVLLQVDQAMFRFLVDVRNDELKKTEVISTTVIFSVMQMIALTLVFFILQPFLATDFKWFLLFNVLATSMENMMLQISRGLGNNGVYAFGSFLSATAQIVGNIVFLVVFDMGVMGMIVATIGSHLIAAGVVFVKLKIYKMMNVSMFRKQQLVSILKYSLPLIPNALSWWAINASDRSIVLLFLGTSYNGLLSVAHKFSTIYITFYNIFNMSWTESASLHINDEDCETFFSEVITNMFKLFMSIAVGIIACMPFVFPILINAKFGEAYEIIPIFMLASMLNVVVGLYSVVYVALKKTKEIAKTSIYSGIVNIIVHLLLINHVGLKASAISTVVAFLVILIIRYRDLKKYINISIPIKWIAVVSLMYIWTAVAYYSSNTVLQAGALILDATIAFVLNKNILFSGIKMVVEKLK